MQWVPKSMFAVILTACLATVALGNPPANPAHSAVEIPSAAPVFHPPEATEQWNAWRHSLVQWRADARASVGYDDTLYRQREFAWTQANFHCGFVMLWDEMFWNWREGRFNDDKLLDDAVRRFGGFDSVVLWHAYPRIGFDQRNQFDFYRDMPGGLEGLRRLSQRLRSRGVRVFLDYTPWDVGTRREGKADAAALAELVRAIDADGIFLDTLHSSGDDLRQRLDAARPGVALESELELPLASIHDHHLSWAQFGQQIRPTGPTGVLRNKWFEPRHMMHVIDRWQRDHTAELHLAWLNGAGMLVWENVFGQLRIWSPRDQSILRAMAPVQRRYAAHFSHGRWTPLVATAHKDVFATLFERDGVRLWLLINRANEETGETTLLSVSPRDGDLWFDLVHGRELRPAAPTRDETFVELAGRLPGRGVGALLAGPRERLGDDFAAFLAAQRETNRQACYDPTAEEPQEILRRVRPTRRYAMEELPEGMIAVAAVKFEMHARFASRECGTYQTPLTRTVRLGAFAMDETPVTNAQFAEFLARSGYRPKHSENFLRHWAGGRLPAGKADHPVVYVDLDDARAYAHWAGKRLPTEEEWQLAAGGPAQLEYPWGGEFDPARCNHGQHGATTTPVRAFPAGRSPLGFFDMCGNTWEWTESERRDGRTRFCVVKGGSYFKAEGSRWYAPGGPQGVRDAAKFLLMWPGLDRSATIGFRCVVDLE